MACPLLFPRRRQDLLPPAVPLLAGHAVDAPSLSALPEGPRKVGGRAVVLQGGAGKPSRVLAKGEVVEGLPVP